MIALFDYFLSAHNTSHNECQSNGYANRQNTWQEECMIKNTERRTIEEFGYFNMDLIALERKYHDRFCPNKQVSIWSKVKKD